MNNYGHLEIIKTVTDVREYLKTVREDNKQILKTQKDINAILIEKLCNQNVDKINYIIPSILREPNQRRKIKSLEYPEYETK
jgi:thymidylate synthase